MWAEAVPNLLIGLREGLEGGLVVSILLAAVHHTADLKSTTENSQAERGVEGTASTWPIWIGVLAALALSLSFGAVLTFSKAALSTSAQEAFGGLLSVIAVGLVTWMIFWMRRTARGLSGELKAKVAVALAMGAGTLAATVFLAVGREGLGTALFIWTAVQAAGDTIVPLVGAAIGVGLAVLLCWLLYRRAIRINLGMFFSRTAVALVVIAGGVLAAGLGDLQEAGVLPGHSWLAFDLTGSVAPDSWWVTLIRGVTNLTPAMTWLQIVAFVGYIGVVLVVFFRATPVTEPPSTPPAEAPKPMGRVPALIGRTNRWIVVAVVVLIPLLAAGSFAVFGGNGGKGSSGATQRVTITASACAPEFAGLAAGPQTFTVVNKSGHAGEVFLVRGNDGLAIGELDSIGPNTQRTLSVTITGGSYNWRCQMSGAGATQSASVRVNGDGRVVNPRLFALPPLQPNELDVPIQQYQTYVAQQLGVLAAQVGTLTAAVRAGNLDGARAAWLPAQLTWERVGAAYGSFGDLADAIDGDPHGLPLGVDDPNWTGLRRLEYGLWHGQSTAALAPIATQLATNVAALQQKLPTFAEDPKDMTIRAHEILEDALRDHLSGLSNQGAGTGFPETLADVDGTRVVVGELTQLINERKPGLVDAINRDLDRLDQALRATQHNNTWDDATIAPLAERQRVNAAIGQALETISPVPDLLEIGTS